MIRKFLVIILVLSISLLALVLAIEENAYDLEYYTESFENNAVYDTTGKTEEELELVSKDIIDYLKGKDDSLLDTHFNQKEIQHMEDVLSLFDLVRLVKFVSLISALAVAAYFIIKLETKFAGKWLGLGLFLNYLLVLIVAILARTDFTKYFIYFHEIFFDNDLWILDPRTDLLIQMLPEPFFINIAIKIGISFIKYVVIGQLIGYILFRKGTYGIGRFKWQRM